MKLFTRGFLLGVFVLAASRGYASNSVVVESKSVAPGAEGVQVGIYITNDVCYLQLLMPLEIREVTTGSYITGDTLSAVYQGRGSIAQFYHNQRPTTGTNTCSGPTSHTFPAPNTAIDFSSPDALRLNKVWYPTGMSAGSDGSPGAGTPGIVLTFDVTCVEGTFEIDTCCFSPDHLFAVDCSSNAVYPTFTKGVITIDAAELTCACNHAPADVNCDGAPDALDLGYLIDIIYGGEPVPGPCCIEE